MRNKTQEKRHSILKYDRYRLFKEDYKKKLSCAHCGYDTYPLILQFHHLRDKDKEINRCNSKRSFLREVKKCIPLCPNCHSILHMKERGLLK